MRRELFKDYMMIIWWNVWLIDWLVDWLIDWLIVNDWLIILIIWLGIWHQVLFDNLYFLIDFIVIIDAYLWAFDLTFSDYLMLIWWLFCFNFFDDLMIDDD